MDFPDSVFPSIHGFFNQFSMGFLCFFSICFHVVFFPGFPWLFHIFSMDFAVKKSIPLAILMWRRLEASGLVALTQASMAWARWISGEKPWRTDSEWPIRDLLSYKRSISSYIHFPCFTIICPSICFRGWDWCPNVSHHPTDRGYIISNRYLKVMWKKIPPKKDVYQPLL